MFDSSTAPPRSWLRTFFGAKTSKKLLYSCALLAEGLLKFVSVVMDDKLSSDGVDDEVEDVDLPPLGVAAALEDDLRLSFEIRGSPYRCVASSVSSRNSTSPGVAI